VEVPGSNARRRLLVPFVEMYMIVMGLSHDDMVQRF